MSFTRTYFEESTG